MMTSQLEALRADLAAIEAALADETRSPKERIPDAMRAAELRAALFEAERPTPEQIAAAQAEMEAQERAAVEQEGA